MDNGPSIDGPLYTGLMKSLEEKFPRTGIHWNCSETQAAAIKADL